MPDCPTRISGGIEPAYVLVMIRRMNNRTAVAVAVCAVIALSLAGCSGSKASSALDACREEAEAQLKTSINSGALESINMGDTLYEGGITDERETSDENAYFVVSGEFTFEKDGKESRRSMVCSVKYEDGMAGDPDLAMTSK